MGALAAHLFCYIQDADFYRELHRQAVKLLPPGAGKTWFDIGCGPGLVARVARDHGYDAVGFDPDGDMVRLARQRSHARTGPRFLQSSLEHVRAQYGRADVVSAASLLFVLRDREAGFGKLLDIVAPGGALLIVETSERMASRSALLSSLNCGVGGRRAWLLHVWTHVRRGTNAVDVEALCKPGYAVERHGLLGGLVNAWIVRP
jgi:ubiquinone/menaquinone biosynthesis C-methylase UbiE